MKFSKVLLVFILIISMVLPNAVTDAAQQDIEITDVHFLLNDDGEVFVTKEGNINVYVNLINRRQSTAEVMLIVAVYSKGDADLRDIMITHETLANGETTVVVEMKNITLTDSLKVFFWENNLTPLMDDLDLDSDEDATFFERLEHIFDRYLPWLCNIYDSEQKGFYISRSGKDDPDVDTTIEASVWAIRMLYEYTDLMASIPEGVRQDWIEYFNSRQDAETGLYVDTQGPVDDSNTSRNNASAYSCVVNYLGATPAYPHPFYDIPVATTRLFMLADVDEQVSAIQTTETNVIPEYMDSPEALVNWLDSFNWEYDSWRGAGECESSVVYFNMLAEPQKSEMVNTLFDWLNSHQLDNGLWSTICDFNALSGVYKLTSVYNSFNRSMPKVDKIFDSTEQCFNENTPETAHYVRNPISAIARLVAKKPEYAQRARTLVLDNADAIINNIERVLAPDGGFGEYAFWCTNNFGGHYVGHSLWEGEIDTSMMILNAREDIYTIFGLDTPKLTMEGFWDVIEGRVSVPESYDEKYADIIQAQAEGIVGDATLSVEDFESYKAGVLTKTLDGSMLIGGSNAAIEDENGNNYLTFTYDGQGNTQPTFRIPVLDDSADGIAQIRFDACPVTNVVELKLKVVNCDPGKANFVLGFGYIPAYAMYFKGTSNGKMSFSSYLQNGWPVNETTGYIPVEEWVDMKVEYTRGSTTTNSVINVYVNDILVNTNNHTCNMNNGLSSRSMQKTIYLAFARVGNGTVCIDDIKFYKQ